MIRNVLNFTVFLAVLTSSVYAQSDLSKIEWISIEEALERQQLDPKKLLVEVYTDWCKVCHKLDQISLSQPQVAIYVNENYYAVKFNAESKKAINFMGKQYSFVEKSNNGYHEFAYKITHGKLNYPSLVFLDKDLSIIQSIYGFHGPDKLLKVLTYFAEDYNKKLPWKDFNAQYNNMIYNSSSSLPRNN